MDTKQRDELKKVMAQAIDENFVCSAELTTTDIEYRVIQIQKTVDRIEAGTAQWLKYILEKLADLEAKIEGRKND